MDQLHGHAITERTLKFSQACNSPLAAGIAGAFAFTDVDAAGALVRLDVDAALRANELVDEAALALLAPTVSVLNSLLKLVVVLDRDML